MKFKTQYNQKDFPDKGEINNSPSETIPDMSLSIRELLDRQARGIPVSGNKNPQFDEEDPDDAFLSIDLAGKDLAEREELLRLAKEEVSRLRGILNHKVALKREADKKADLDKQRKEWDELQSQRENKDKVKPQLRSDESTNTP